MGTHLPRNGSHAEEKSVGVPIASQEPSGRDDQVVDMACDPPIGSTCTVGGEGNCKVSMNSAAAGERTSGSLPMTRTNCLCNNVGDGTLRRRSFSGLTEFLLRLFAGKERKFDEHRNFCLAAMVQFLEEANIEFARAASQQIVNFQSKVTRLTTRHKQQLAKIQQLSLDLENLRIANRNLQALLNKESGLRQELSASRDRVLENMKAQIVNREAQLCRSQEVEAAKQREVDRLKSDIGQKEKDLSNAEAAKAQLDSEYQKLKAKLATIEQKSAQESLTSGSYADGHVNPSMVEIACKAVDKATDSLVRILHENSITSKSSINAPELLRFIRKLSSAEPSDFSRSAHLKHVWGHWICARMFQGFEHVFFDIDGDRTSPLDFKAHASKCFQSFQQYKDASASEICKGCPMFEAFVRKAHSVLFPLTIVNEGLLLATHPITSYNRDGRIDGDEKLFSGFGDVAKAVWLLHELCFAFDPPARILRMGSGTPFSEQHHESLIKDSANDENCARVALMVRPGFLIRNTIIKSRVFLSKK